MVWSHKNLFTNLTFLNLYFEKTKMCEKTEILVKDLRLDDGSMFYDSIHTNFVSKQLPPTYYFNQLNSILEKKGFETQTHFPYFEISKNDISKFIRFLHPNKVHKHNEKSIRIYFNSSIKTANNKI